MERITRIELATFSMATRRSTTELNPPKIGIVDNNGPLKRCQRKNKTRFLIKTLSVRLFFTQLTLIQIKVKFNNGNHSYR